MRSSYAGLVLRYAGLVLLGFGNESKYCFFFLFSFFFLFD